VRRHAKPYEVKLETGLFSITFYNGIGIIPDVAASK
jgi:hypothetical protein